jgi:hypothetical protein
MNPFDDAEQRLQRLRDAVNAEWSGKENLVGTLVDRTLLRLQDCGDHADDAVIVFLEALHDAGGQGQILGKLWKAHRDRHCIDAWFYNHNERWRSVSFEFSFQRGLPSTDLYLCVSTFVPMGVDKDPSHYPVEETTSYLRPTQRLHAVYNLSARRSLSQSRSETESRDQSSSNYSGTDRTKRDSRALSQSTSHGTRQSWSQGDELSEHIVGGPWLGERKSTSSKRNGYSLDISVDNREDRSWSRAEDDAQSSGHRSEWTDRSADSRSDEQTTELTASVNFVGVGPDFTQVDKMYAAWRSDPGNAQPSMMIDLVQMSLPGLGQYIENGVAHRRLARRARSRGGQAIQLDFWDEARQLIGGYRPEAFGQRRELPHSGYPQAIDGPRIAKALDAARGDLRGIENQRFLLP